MVSTNVAQKKTKEPVFETINTAVQISKNNERNASWHEIRAKGIGGSHVGIICGYSKWDSPISLWAIKTGKVEKDRTENPAMEWGNRLEPVVIQKFEDEHPELTMIKDVGTWKHSEREWQIANPDALYRTATGEIGILEIKTGAYKEDWINSQTGELKVPLSYLAQVLWYMDIFDAKEGWIAALIGGREYLEIKIEADRFQMDANMARVEMFRKHLLEDTQPDFDGAASTLETIRKMHPLIEDRTVALDEMGEQYLETVSSFDFAQAEMNEIKSRVLDSMGKAKYGAIGDRVIVTRQAGRGGNPPFLVNKRGVKNG
jgi:putative phage-type endonuclease